MPNLELQARDVGLSFLYDGLYLYQSNAGPHPTMLAVDLLLEKHLKGLVLRGEPTAQFVAHPSTCTMHGCCMMRSRIAASSRPRSTCANSPR